MEIQEGTKSLKVRITYAIAKINNQYNIGISIFFCGICGANVYNKSVNPKFRYGQCAINMRLLHDIDLENIEISKGDGKNIHLPPLEENPI
ncbi:hypothetical protein N7524_001103 [Penicillium chrysogenum]|nr:hypothetical protein N7524_001103 [Penicillium chrysogenum]